MNTNSTFTCFNCNSKVCKDTNDGTFEICQYGISFLNRKGNIEVREPKIPLSTIAKNLRHEINPILQTIIQQVSIIDPTLSTKKIELQKPLSKIIGSTVILDLFIQMITGVHEFHSVPSTSSKKIYLHHLINNFYDIYSIIEEEGRTNNLQINNLIPKDLIITKNSDFIQYMVSILIDNAWKYSLNNSTLTINYKRISDKNISISFNNKSKTIPEYLNIFEMGTKVEKDSKGFGYGLNWIKDLEVNYNTSLNINKEKFIITHKQLTPEKDFSFQSFELNNIKI